MFPYPVQQERVHSPRVKTAVSRCRLQQPFYQWCLGLAASSQFGEVIAPLASMLRDTFAGWVQSRVCEKANKVLRESEKQQNPNKALGPMKNRPRGHVRQKRQPPSIETLVK